MASWYKHDIAAWMDGTGGLSHEAYRLYHVVCQFIYEQEGSILLNEKRLAGAAEMSTRAVRAALDELFQRQKLALVDGRLENIRAKKELENLRTRRELSRKGGEQSAKGREQVKNINQNNGTAQVIFPDHFNHKTRLEETREEKKESCPVGKPTRTKAEYSEQFEKEFWNPYPRSPTMSKIEAWKVWQKLPPEKRVLACKAIDPYKRFLRSKPDLATVHACRFLSQERFEGLVNQAGGAVPIDIGGHFI